MHYAFLNVYYQCYYTVVIIPVNNLIIDVVHPFMFQLYHSGALQVFSSSFFFLVAYI